MYKLNEEKMFYDMADGQAIVINFITGMYYGTSTLGSVVLDRLLAGAAPAAVASAVKALPGCPGDMDEKIKDFIARLEEKEIIISGDTLPGGDGPVDASALEDGFELALDEFAEVQDLILADPVHDVDVEQGWPILKQEQ